MIAAAAIREHPKPPALHTDEAVRAIGMPDLKAGRPAGDIEEHWLGVWNLILALLHFFGAPAAFYATGAHSLKDRKPALDYLRALEAMIRRILLIMAGNDARPLEPFMPRAARTSNAPNTPGAGQAQYSGLPPKSLPIRFVLSPPAIAPRTDKSVQKPRPAREREPVCLTEPLPPELDNPQTRRRERLLVADHWEAVKARRLWPVYGLAARFEALIRVYKNPWPYVMRVRQRIAAEQGRHAAIICARMLQEPPRLQRGMAEMLAGMFWEACAAIRSLRQTVSGRAPPIADA